MQLKSSQAKPFSLWARLDKQPHRLPIGKRLALSTRLSHRIPIPGTDSVVNTEAEDLRERVMELTGVKGADVVFDTVGRPMFEPALRSLGIGGRQVAEIEDELRRGFETGALKPPPIEAVPFVNALDAYSRVAAGQARTKQVLSFC
jgi:hypothetical protein